MTGREPYCGVGEGRAALSAERAKLRFQVAEKNVLRLIHLLDQAEAEVQFSKDRYLDADMCLEIIPKLRITIGCYWERRVKIEEAYAIRRAYEIRMHKFDRVVKLIQADLYGTRGWAHELEAARSALAQADRNGPT